MGPLELNFIVADVNLSTVKCIVIEITIANDLVKATYFCRYIFAKSMIHISAVDVSCSSRFTCIIIVSITKFNRIGRHTHYRISLVVNFRIELDTCTHIKLGLFAILPLGSYETIVRIFSAKIPQPYIAIDFYITYAVLQTTNTNA